MHWYVWIFALVSFSGISFSSGESTCEYVKIKGPSGVQPTRVGAKYKKTNQLHDGKSVFKHTDKTDYIYWTGYDFAWNVGPQLNGSHVGLYVFDNASHPVDVGNTWIVLYFVSFYYHPDISIECSSKSILGWGIALCVFGSIFLIIAIIAIVVCCIKKHQRPQQRVQTIPVQSTNTHPRNYPSHSGFVASAQYNSHNDHVAFYGMPPSYYGPPPPGYQQQHQTKQAWNTAGTPPTYSQGVPTHQATPGFPPPRPSQGFAPNVGRPRQIPVYGDQLRRDGRMVDEEEEGSGGTRQY